MCQIWSLFIFFKALPSWSVRFSSFLISFLLYDSYNLLRSTDGMIALDTFHLFLIFLLCLTNRISLSNNIKVKKIFSFLLFFILLFDQTHPNLLFFNRISSFSTVSATTFLIQPSSLTTKLIAYYPFNGNVNDVSGNNNDGTIYGTVAATTDRLGLPNSAYSFDGATGYIAIPGSAFTYNNDFSVSFWIRPSATQLQYATIMEKSHGGAAISWSLEGNGAVNSNTYALYYGSGGTWINPVAVALAASVWAHVVIVKSDFTVTVYLNGAIQSSGTATAKIITTCAANLPLILGAWNSAQTQPPAGITRYFTGSLDDLLFYNRTLSAPEVSLLFSFPQTPTSQPSRQPTSQPTRQPSSQPSIQPSGRPSGQPSSQPSAQPTSQPSRQPTSRPSAQPSAQPSTQPSSQPSSQPSRRPSGQPSSHPSGQPSSLPTSRPSRQPTSQPSSHPSIQPTVQPSSRPSSQPSGRPSGQPSSHPSGQPSSQPTSRPSRQPTSKPSSQPSVQPAVHPSSHPSSQPSGKPSTQPSFYPSSQPSSQPTSRPSRQPTSQPSSQPSVQPSNQPSSQPSAQPSGKPSGQPSSHPSSVPSSQPTSQPSRQPTSQPSSQPSVQPSNQPSSRPSDQPSGEPSKQPSSHPSSVPSSQPTSRPSRQPTSQPSSQPSVQPSNQPSSQPSAQPSGKPSGQPSSHPSSVPSSQPTSPPSRQPTSQPSSQPSVQPLNQPSSRPSDQPSGEPSGQPSSRPSSQPSFQPFSRPSSQPTSQPVPFPSTQPSVMPSSQPTRQPSRQPTGHPTFSPTSQPSSQPNSVPSAQPLAFPSGQPSSRPSSQPSKHPSSQPSCQPSVAPSFQPTSFPTRKPTDQPSSQPSVIPSVQPSSSPSVRPSSQPSVPPSVPPSCQPSSLPSSIPSSAPTNEPHHVVTSIPISILPGNLKFKTMNFLLIPPISSFHQSALTDISLSNRSSEETVGRNYILYGQKECFPSNIIDVNFPLINLPTNFSSSNFVFPVIEQLSYGLSLNYLSNAMSVSMEGDFNGDLITDLVIGDPSKSSVYVLFGNKVEETGGEAGVGERTYQNMTTGFIISDINLYSQLGWSTSTAGDWNQDSVDDVLMSALGTSTVYIIYGRKQNITNVHVNEHWISDDQGLIIKLDSSIKSSLTGSSSTQSAYFGGSVSFAGDINSDGWFDIIMNNEINDGSNILYLLFGHSSFLSLKRLVINEEFLQNSAFIVKIESSKFAFAGLSLTSLGDINGDGYDDIGIGSVPFYKGYGDQVSYILYGRSSFFPSWKTLSLSNITSTLDNQGKPLGIMLKGGGLIVSGVGDLNFDGFNDIMITNYEDWILDSQIPSDAVTSGNQRTGCFTVIYPTPVSQSPTSRPSISPTIFIPPTSQPSSFPTLVPSSSCPSILEEWSDTVKPSISFTPTFLEGAVPSIQPNSNKPSRQPVTPRPSRTPAKSSEKPNTASPLTLSPSFLLTYRPTIPPITLSPSQTALPSSFPTSIPSIAGLLVTQITLSGFYEGIHGNQFFNISPRYNDSVIVIQGGKIGKKTYLIWPKPNCSMYLSVFLDEIDLLDLSLFSESVRFSYSTYPLTIRLPASQRVILSSHNEYDLTPGKSVYLPGSSSAGNGGGDLSSGKYPVLSVSNVFNLQSYESWKIIFAIISCASSFFCLFVCCIKQERSREPEWWKKSKLREQRNSLLPTTNPYLAKRRLPPSLAAVAPVSAASSSSSSTSSNNHHLSPHSMQQSTEYIQRRHYLKQSSLRDVSATVSTVPSLVRQPSSSLPGRRTSMMMFYDYVKNNIMNDGLKEDEYDVSDDNEDDDEVEEKVDEDNDKSFHNTEESGSFSEDRVNHSRHQIPLDSNFTSFDSCRDDEAQSSGYSSNPSRKFRAFSILSDACEDSDLNHSILSKKRRKRRNEIKIVATRLSSSSSSWSDDNRAPVHSTHRNATCESSDDSSDHHKHSSSLSSNLSSSVSSSN
jgi:hypothetical protein